MLRDDELDAVSGGYTLSNCMISGYAVSRLGIDPSDLMAIM